MARSKATDRLMPTQLEGLLSVQAALEAGFRDLQQILIDENKRYDRRLSALRRSAEGAGVAVRFTARSTIDERASGDSHGGVVAEAGDRRFCQLADLLPAKDAAFIVMLDGIEDPYNFAGVIRALYAAGVHGAVVRPRNWTSAAALVGRASAGTIERLPLAVAESAADAAEFFRGRGLVIACAASDDRSKSLYQTDLTRPLFLLIGGERRGVTRSFRRAADLQLRIPYGREFASALGAVSAASVIGFEVMRQRRCKST
ncbi:MAG: RNA methyltransferase [Chloroflexi bacterium]|nr:RNA methyltransferase [Chloroflexota bacterium]